MAFQRVYKAFPPQSSGVVTDAEVESEWFVNPGYKGCVILAERIGEDGSSPTLDVKLQGLFRATGTTFDVANASIEQFTTGETGVRYTVVYPGITADEATGEVVIDDNKYVNGWLPDEFRIVVKHGGTDIENEFAVMVEPLV